MTEPVKSQKYRDMIDHLVNMCRYGQGQIGASRVKDGMWSITALATAENDQYEFNLLLARLSQADRNVIARFMLEQVETGVFETLKALEEFQVTPFESGYEGSSYHDFMGRLNDWPWPEEL